MGSEAVKIYRLRRQTSSTSGGTTQDASPAPSTTDTLASSQTTTDLATSTATGSVTPTASDSNASSSTPTSQNNDASPTSPNGPSTNSSGSSSSTQGSSGTQENSISTTTSSGSTPSPSSSSSASSSQSGGSSSSNSASTSTNPSTTPDTSITPSSTLESLSSLTSSNPPTSTPSPDLSTNSDSATLPTLASSGSSNPNTGVPLTTITSAIVTTIDGQATTIITTIPTTLNSPSPTITSGQRSGIIAGSVIGATLLLLLLLSGLFVYHRRKAQRKIALAHRALPAPRSALLADEDGFDLAGPAQPMGEGVPPLLRPRVPETGSIFQEGVWPPPSERSRLEDPLLAGSNVDLTSIVDSVMGGEGHQHERSSSSSSFSTQPLLANASPVRGGRMPVTGVPPSAFASLASQSVPRERSRLALTSEPSETTPFNPSGHAHQSSLDSDPGSPYRDDYAALPPGAAPPSTGTKRAPSTGTLPSNVPHLRGGASGLGSLVVVNSTPEEENPLVDLTPTREIPPLYHMIRRDTADTWNSANSQTSEADKQITSGSGQARAPSPDDMGRAV